MRKIMSSHGERVVNDIKRKSRKQYSAEKKIRIVLDGLRGEDSIVELCWQEVISQSLCYKKFEGHSGSGQKASRGDTVRQANSTEVKGLRSEARELEECVAQLTLENRVFT